MNNKFLENSFNRSKIALQNILNTTRIILQNKFSHLIIGIFIAWIISLLFFFKLPWFIDIRPEDYAELGNAFGSFNALLSGFAFAGVIYTIWQQQNSLNELKKQSQIQAKTAKLQSLITLHKFVSDTDILATPPDKNNTDTQKSTIQEDSSLAEAIEIGNRMSRISITLKKPFYITEIHRLHDELLRLENDADAIARHESLNKLIDTFCEKLKQEYNENLTHHNKAKNS